MSDTTRDAAACDCNPAGPGPDNAWGDGPPYYDEDCPVHGRPEIIGRPAPAASATLPEAPLVQRAVDPSTVIPATWCVVECCQGCRETWTVDVADFEPSLTASDVERMLTPLLLDHEQAHQGVWR